MKQNLEDFIAMKFYGIKEHLHRNFLFHETAHVSLSIFSYVDPNVSHWRLRYLNAVSYHS